MDTTVITQGIFTYTPPTLDIFNKEFYTEKNGLITISKRPCDKSLLRRLLGSDAKIEALFVQYSYFGLKINSFFKFELIKILEEVNKKKYRYGVDRETVEKALSFLKPKTEEQELREDLDRDHMDRVFAFKPLNHQEKIFRDYINYKHVLGYRGMLMHAAIGMGKTLTSLFIMEGYHKEVEKVIVICPLNTLDRVWVETLSGKPNTGFREKQDYYIVKDGKPYNNEKYILCHYEALDKLENLINKLPKGKIGIIVDESHNLSDSKSKRTDLSLNLVNKLDPSNIILLSGTPIKAGFRELTTLFRFLDNNFNRHVEKRYLNLYRSPTTWLGGVLKERYSGYVSVVTKDESKLDPLQTFTIKLDLNEKLMEPFYLSNIQKDLKAFVKERMAEIQSQMDHWVSSYIELRDKGVGANKNLDKNLYLKYTKDIELIKKTSGFDYYIIKDQLAFCNNFEKNEIMPYLTKEEKELFKDAKTIYKYPVLKVQGEALGKIIGKARIECHRMMAENLDWDNILKATKKKTIVFSNYIEVCEAAMNSTERLDYNPIGVYGEETKNLSSIVEKWSKDKKLNPLVTTYKSLSTGVPLTAADTIICIDLPFRMYVYEQAIGRAWRIGQDSQVSVFILELNTNIPNINSRNVDIIKFFKEEVEKITGVKATVDIATNTEEISIESLYPYDLDEYDPDHYEISTEAGSKNPKRKAVEDLILEYIGKIASGDQNVKLYRDLFAKMSDQEFDQWMHKLKNKERTLSIVVPNGGDVKCSVENNIKVGKELGFEFFQNLKFSPAGNTPGFTTPNQYMILKLPVKRAAQLLSKKISIAKDNKFIDTLTGQVSGDSRASKMTYPETQILLGMGIKDSLIELLKYRGGDKNGANAMNTMLMKTGIVHQKDLEQYSSGVESTKTLKSYLYGMHIKNTLK